MLNYEPVASSLAMKQWSHMGHKQDSPAQAVKKEQTWRYNRYFKHNPVMGEKSSKARLIHNSLSKPSAITNLSSSFVSSASIGSQNKVGKVKYQTIATDSVMHSYQ